MGANPCKCLGDAQKAVAELTKIVKFCTVDNISYEDVFKNTRGRPKNDGKKEEVLATVKVHAAVSINKETVDKAIAQEMMYVIVTTDTERNWTMAELLGGIKDRALSKEAREFVKILASLLIQFT